MYRKRSLYLLVKVPMPILENTHRQVMANSLKRRVANSSSRWCRTPVPLTCGDIRPGRQVQHYPRVQAHHKGTRDIDCRPTKAAPRHCVAVVSLSGVVRRYARRRWTADTGMEPTHSVAAPPDVSHGRWRMFSSSTLIIRSLTCSARLI